MRVLHINSYFTGSKFYKNLYDKQVNSGIDIEVFVPTNLALSNSNNGLGEYTTISYNHSTSDRFLFHLKQSKIYKDIINKYDINHYSLIHAHSLFSNGYIAMKLKETFGIPYIVAVRDTDINVFFKYMIHLRKTGINILEKSSKIVFLSEPYKILTIESFVPTKLKKEILDKSVVIPNGIDDFWLENKLTTKDLILEKEKNIKVLQVGIISKRKNQIMTVKVVESLRKQGYKIELTLVGKIKDNKLFKKINKYKFVNYIEPIPKEQLIHIYRNHDVFVMPSVTETFGLVYAEAISQGLPILYTKNQGFDGQFVNGEVGYSVECYKENDIAIKLLKIIKNYKKYANGISAKCDKFDWERIKNRYSELYEKVRTI